MFETTLRYHSQENVVAPRSEQWNKIQEMGEGRETSCTDCGVVLFLARTARAARASSKGLLIPLLELQRWLKQRGFVVWGNRDRSNTVHTEPLQQLLGAL